jgi:membrane protease YdiL (CAAX protease family)
MGVWLGVFAGLIFAGGGLIYLSAAASLLTLARLFGKGDAAAMLGWTGVWPAIMRTGWLLIFCALLYHIVAGATLRYFFPEFALWIIPPRDAMALILSFVMIVILAPLVEELLFRGWIFGSLRARFSAGVTILVTAVLFAIVHMDPTGLYPLAVLAPGLVLSVIRERTGSVKGAILAHAIYNGIGWLLLVFATAFFLR